MKRFCDKDKQIIFGVNLAQFTLISGMRIYYNTNLYCTFE